MSGPRWMGRLEVEGQGMGRIDAGVVGLAGCAYIVSLLILSL